MAHLVAALRDPASVTTLGGAQWSALISVARSEVLLGTLAHRLTDQALPAVVVDLLAATRTAMAQAQVQALWEAEMARRALHPAGVRFLLLKGAAYAAAGLPNAAGRQIGDLDILVAAGDLAQAEAALLAAGWEWVKSDPYDDAYYRQHMHELPPLIHTARDRMIDVHHSILPLTHRASPDPAVMLADAVVTTTGHAVPCADDLVVHCAAHLIADGELDGGLRNLWDLHCLLSGVADAGGWGRLRARAGHHQLWPALARGARLCQRLFATPVPAGWAGPAMMVDSLFVRRLLARDDWGRDIHRVTRLGFTVRGHLMRMPLRPLMRHLWVKWRR